MQRLNENIMFEQYPDTGVVIIAFTGGYEKGLQSNSFEWLKATGSYPYSRIFVRDTTGQMCVDGIDRQLDSFDKLLGALREIIQHLKATQIITIGSSAAAFPAILAAHLLKADYCHAFSPLPYSSLKRSLLRMDKRMIQLILRNGVFHYLSRIPFRKYYDLGKDLSNTNGHTRYFIHVCRHSRIDMKRAQYLSNFPNVNLIDYSCDQHTVARYLAKHKCLGELFNINNQNQLLKMEFLQNAITNKGYKTNPIHVAT